MRVKRERKPVEVICVDCKKPFIAYNRAALRCAECKLEEKRRAAATGMASYRNGSKKKPYKVNKTIREVLVELEKYNKEHKTHISYGKFVQMIGG